MISLLQINRDIVKNKSVTIFLSSSVPQYQNISLTVKLVYTNPFTVFLEKRKNVLFFEFCLIYITRKNIKMK